VVNRFYIYSYFIANHSLKDHSWGQKIKNGCTWSRRGKRILGLNFIIPWHRQQWSIHFTTPLKSESNLLWIQLVYSIYKHGCFWCRACTVQRSVVEHFCARYRKPPWNHSSRMYSQRRKFFYEQASDITNCLSLLITALYSVLPHSTCHALLEWKNV